MARRLRKIYPIYLLVDLILIAISFYSPYLLKYNSPANIFLKLNTPNLQKYSFIFILWTIFIIISFRRKNLYSTERTVNIPQEISRIVFVILYTGILMSAITFFAKYDFFSREVFFKNIFLLFIFLNSWRIVKRLILRRLIMGGFHNINVLIIGAGKAGAFILDEIMRNPAWGFHVVGFLDDNKNESVRDVPILAKLKSFSTITKKYFVDEVIISIPSERKVVSELVKQTKKMRLGLNILPDNFEEPLTTLDINYLGMIPMLTYKERRPHPAEFAVKRLFDFLVSLIALIVLLPLFLIIAIWIKLDSRGPVFYIQKRSGFKGRKFNFYKFRSMIKKADEVKSGLMDKNESRGKVIFKMKKDPRVTSVGKFLRRYSLDEFPQLINVLKGDMSLVGPRPFPVEESQKMEHSYLERLSIRPGITGLAQIKGRSDLSFYHWVRWDLWYVNHYSFWLDLVILFRTLPVVVKGRGAY